MLIICFFFKMDNSDTNGKIQKLSDKISAYKAMLSSNKIIYEALQMRIYELSVEFASGMNDIQVGSNITEDLSSSYIKSNIVQGLKQKAVRLIEDEVILEFMISERVEELAVLKQQQAIQQCSDAT